MDIRLINLGGGSYVETTAKAIKFVVRLYNSLIDKVYHPSNLKLAWEAVKANKGSEGIRYQPALN